MPQHTPKPPSGEWPWATPELFSALRDQANTHGWRLNADGQFGNSFLQVYGLKIHEETWAIYVDLSGDVVQVSVYRDASKIAKLDNEDPEPDEHQTFDKTDTAAAVATTFWEQMRLPAGTDQNE
jgi:hypothetical protein